MIGWQAAYIQARKLEKKGSWDAAIRMYAGLLKRGEDSNPKVLFRMGYALFRKDLLDQAIPHLERAIEIEPQNADWEYRLGFVFERQKDYRRAIKHYTRAIELDSSEPKWQDRRRKCFSALESAEQAVHKSALKDVMSRNGPAWERLDMLEAGYTSHAKDTKWLKDLATANFRMNRFETAAGLFSEVLQLQPKDAESHFMEGWSWQSCGRNVIAEKCFSHAVKHDTRLNAGLLGVGIFYENKGQWSLAAEAYKKSLVDRADSAELNFHAGLALQKTYAWKEAERYLSRAIMLDPDVPLWHYRRGLSYERLGDLRLAAEGYAEAAFLGRSLYWFYRLGQVLESLGDYQGACEAYAQSHAAVMPDSMAGQVLEPVRRRQYQESLLSQSLADALTSQSGSLCYTVGRKAEALGLLAIAEQAYRAATARIEEHTPNLYYSLGRVLAAQGKWQEGSEAFAGTRIFRRPFGVDVQPYLKSKASRNSMTYLEYVESTAIKDNVVLYESSHGASIGCNPLALYRRMVTDARFSGFTHVWVLNDKRRTPTELRAHKNVIIVSRESDLYLRYLASAKYLINNNTFPPYFIRRDGQQYLNTWHGTPIKTLGRDIQSGVMDHKNAARNFLHTTHMIFPNKFTAECLIEKYDIGDIYNGNLAITGYPRNDSVAAPSESKQAEIRKRLGIQDGQSVVLYAPTWRGTLAKKSFDESRLTKDLEAFGAGDWHFLYRGHAVDEGSASGTITDRFSVPTDIDTNDLLSIVDVLVTDYSSIMFDFMATGRPIVYYAYDLEEYKIERGLYFDLDNMGGTVCRDIDDVLSAVSDAVTHGDPGPAFNPQVKEFYELESGHSSKRVIDFFFFGESGFTYSREGNSRPNALLYAGSFIPNGVTASYLNLMSELPAGRYNLHTVVDPVTIASDAGRQAKFISSPDHVHAIGRVGIHLVTPEERWVIDKFNSQNNLDADEMWGIYDRAHRREFLRIFGAARFDAVVCFEGYARFWASVLGNPTNRPKVSSIYLHSVMREEWRNRFPYLEGVFRLYSRYDRLLSVSESASIANSKDLALKFNLPVEAFNYVNNVINPSEVVEASRQALDDDVRQWVRSGQTTFISVGRLSPEKGHLKLLAAFAEVVAAFPQARLIVVGDGPMRDRIAAKVRELGMEDNVYLAGMRMNPYSILMMADCFVFSSDYEGQGIAILEALVLGKPVISTDVIGARSVLEGGYGLLVPNSSEALADGMQRFMREGLSFEHFDYELYQKAGIESFDLVALGGLHGTTNAAQRSHGRHDD